MARRWATASGPCHLVRTSNKNGSNSQFSRNKKNTNLIILDFIVFLLVKPFHFLLFNKLITKYAFDLANAWSFCVPVNDVI